MEEETKTEEKEERTDKTEPTRHKKRERHDAKGGAKRPRKSRKWLSFLLFLLLLGAAAYLAAVDWQNRGRFRLHCIRDALVAQQHKRLPWPFGWETIGGPAKPIPLTADSPCVTQVIDGKTELYQAAQRLMVEQAKLRLATSNPNLVIVRGLLSQAIAIDNAETSTTRNEAIALLAELDYRDARATLTNVERQLRTALNNLHNVEQSRPDKFVDVSHWIARVEKLLALLSGGDQTEPNRPTTHIPKPESTPPTASPKSPQPKENRPAKPGLLL